MIKAEQLVKKYRSGDTDLTVLKFLNVEIHNGEFVAIIGPSGAGKSTLMYQLSLLDKPTNGEVTINGVKTSRLSESEKTAFRLNKLGYVFQDYALLPELTSIENIMLPMLMQGISRAVAFQKGEATLKRIGMHDKMYNLPSQLSGGQQQRVSIARAIAHDPDIVFADEPTANLDSENSELVLQTFLDLNKMGLTIVMVTHEADYAAHSGRIISMKDGEVISDVRSS